MNSTRGFTLIEVLVALGVLSIAVLALIKVQAESAAAASATRARLFAQIVAENRLVEIVSAAEIPVLGASSGEVRLADQAWIWTQDVTKTGDRGITRIDVFVRRPEDETILATLAGFKGL